MKLMTLLAPRTERRLQELLARVGVEESSPWLADALGSADIFQWSLRWTDWAQISSGCNLKGA